MLVNQPYLQTLQLFKPSLTAGSIEAVRVEVILPFFEAIFVGRGFVAILTGGKAVEIALTFEGR
jgi:hypothetical protein